MENISNQDNNYSKIDKEGQNYELIYSPRTSYSNDLDYEEILFNDLTLNFDPITIKIIKKHFKERLGSLNKIEFISILKNHLLSWHSEHPQREKMLIKLLGRLFSEIDLNDNGSMEWSEFTNYIIHNSNSTNGKNDNSSFRLRFYSNARNTLDTRELSENVSYAFYIEKFSMIGIVEDGKSLIHFYDGNTLKKLKCMIDLKDILKDIDDLENRDLDERADKKKQEEKEEKRKIKLAQIRNQKKFMPKNIKSRSISQEKIINEETLISNFKDTKSHNTTESPIKKQRTNLTFKSQIKGTRIGTKGKVTRKSNKINETEEEDEDDFMEKKKIEKKADNLIDIINSGINSLLSKPKKAQDNNEMSEVSKKFIDYDLNRRRNPMSKNIYKKLTTICATFLPEYDVLLLSATNNRISAWKFLNGEFKNANSIREPMNIDKNYFVCSILVTSSPQYCMTWDPLHKTLYSGQKDGKILKWDLIKSTPVGALDVGKQDKKDSSKIMNTYSTEESVQVFNNDMQIRDHKDMNKKIQKQKYFKRDSVSYILIINKIQILAASYYNGKIILWDTLLMDKRKKYHDHKTGIYHMTYDSTKNLLFSCGFDHDIYVYDPYIDFPVYKLQGHYGSINNVICNEKDSELISLDIYGNIKIWDTHFLVNFQTINLNESTDSNKISSNLKMIYLKKQKKIMVYGSKVIFFETDKSLNPELADDQIIFACFYDKVAKSIISFCLRKIKMWNPFTGKIKKVYEDPMQNEITALTIDRNMKRSFLGDNMGKIKCFNMKNGKYLKDLTPHELEINMLVHSLELNIVVSCSVDNVIKIHDDKELMDTVMIKELKVIGNQVKSIAIMDNLKRLVLGLSNGIIKFYDIEHFRYDSDLHSEANSSNDEVTCLFPFNDYELVFSGHSSGLCKFMVTPPNTLKFNNFLEFINIDEKDEKNYLPITCMDFDYENKKMYCGDQRGVIKCFSLKALFDLIDECKMSGEFLKKVKNITIEKLWYTEAHKESIKHIHFSK
jgi:hypothetical protein